jgi:organic radical activating enzyme
MKSTDEEFVEAARREKARFAVLTGGEPLMNKQLPRVVELLRKEGFKIAAESNGTFPPPVPLDWLTISPKRFTKDKKMDPYWVHPDAFDRCQEFKYVVDSEFDFSVLDRHRGRGLARLSLSPEFNDFRGNVAKIIEYVKENPEWAISLQTHKFLGVQ